jgi:hypothetical protein
VGEHGEVAAELQQRASTCSRKENGPGHAPSPSDPGPLGTLCKRTRARRRLSTP